MLSVLATATLHPLLDLAATDLFSNSVISLFQEYDINGILQDVTFWNCLLSLSIIPRVGVCPQVIVSAF